MIENLQEKKRLIQEVHSKAKKDGSDTSISGVFKYLERILLDDFKFSLNYRTMLGYYQSIIDNNNDVPIKPITLDMFSKYLGFDNFNHYRKKRGMNTISPDGNTTVTVSTGGKENSFSDAVSNIMIIIKNQPIFNVPQMAKNGMGIGAMIFILMASFAYGSGGIPSIYEDKYMYWKDNEYVGTDSAYVNSGIEVIAMNKNLLLHLKKITRPDTLTIENSKGKVWYDKSNNHVEFFTSPGIHPENGKALKDISETIINNHAGLEEE